MKDEQKTDLSEKKPVQPLSYDPDGEILDWDAYIPPPPAKNKRKIAFVITYNGRAKPMYHPKLEEDKTT